jgi:predicted aspartyl protease
VPGVRSALVSGLTAAVLAAAATAQTPLEEDRVTLNFGRTDAGHYTLDVGFAALAPLPLIFDTAASHTSIVEPVAVELGFIATGELHDVQTVTEAIRAERHSVGPVAVGPYQVAGVDAVVIAAEPDEPLSLFGLLGADVFAHQSIQADLASGTLTIASEPPRHDDGLVHPERDVLIGSARLSGARGRVRTLVDTGSLRTIVNTEVAKMMSRTYSTSRVTVGSVDRAAEQLNDAGLVRIERVRIGGLCVGPLLAVKADVDVFRAMGWEDEPAMILGLDALQLAEITVDYPTGVFQLSAGGDARDCRTARVQLQTQS